MIALVRPAVVVTLFFTLLLGVAYPLAITGIAGAAFPAQAGGSLIRDAGGQVIGSRLIAQGFTKPQYLHPRPSAAGTNGYDAAGSSGSNLGPLNPMLIDRMTKDSAAYRAAEKTDSVPADAVTTSASGLDPDISPENARAQAARIASARGVPVETVLKVISDATRAPLLGFLGQPAVNVLEANLALDAAVPKDQRPPR
jgi:K+-transporting ATPase ATPase C chain